MNTCIVPGCDKPVKSKNLKYCSTHYAQIHKYGGIKHLRTEPNEHETIGESVYIALYDKTHAPIGERCIIDVGDYNLIKNKRITLQYTKTSRRILVFDKARGCLGKLHRIIMNAPEGTDVDHINGNQLDNRRCNLRICSRSQNNMNTRKRKGYSVHSQNKTYSVELQANGKRIRIHGIKTEAEAMAKRAEIEKQYFGDFAPDRSTL